jgi:N-acetylmuramic acid 6-phosphate (MurNAc-6-P) etherase
MSSILLRSAAHCFCMYKHMIEQGDGYCVKELDERPSDETHTIFLGMTDRKNVRDAIQYQIESVRVPRERIAMYARMKTVGTDDIALIKTTTDVVFILGKIMPVCA